MIEQIIIFLNQQLSGLNILDKRFGLVKKVFKEDIGYPAEYESKGEGNPIEIDKFKGVSWFRITGPIDREELDEEKSPIGGEVFERRTYPLRFFATVPKDIYNTDNAFIDIKIAENFIKTLSSLNNNTLTSQLKAALIRIAATESDIIPESVLNEEYDDIEFPVQLDKVYVGIDLSVEIEATKNCFELHDCNDGDATFDPCAEECVDGQVSNSDDSFIEPVPSGESVELPDIQVTDSDGSSAPFPSNKDVICTPSPDARVSNSDDSYDVNVAAGGDLELPDITITDSDLTPVVIPSVQDFVCTPQVNNTQILFSFDEGVFESGVLNISEGSSDGTYNAVTEINAGEVIYIHNDEEVDSPSITPLVLVDGDALQVERDEADLEGGVQISGTFIPS